MSKPIISFSDIDSLVRGDVVEFFPETFEGLPIHYVCKEIDEYGYIHLIGEHPEDDLVRLTIHTSCLKVGPFETLSVERRSPYHVFQAIPEEEVLYSSTRNLSKE